MSDHGFARCDGEFEVIGEDLNMSTMGIVQMTLAEPWKAPDISRELALLDAHYQNSMKNKEDKQMLAIGTKVIVRTCNDYNGRYTGKIGIVCKHWNKSKRVGVTLDGIKNPDSKEGVFWFSENSVMLYKQPTTMLNPGNVKSVIFSSDKTIVLWDDGTKTIVTCGEGDSFDPYAGFCAAVTKKVFGTTSCVKRIIKQNSKTVPVKVKKTNTSNKEG